MQNRLQETVKMLRGGGTKEPFFQKHKNLINIFFIIFLNIFIHLIFSFPVNAGVTGIGDFNNIAYGDAYINNVSNTNAQITVHNTTNFNLITGTDGLPSIVTKNVTSDSVIWTNPYSIKFTNVGRDCTTGEYLDLVIDCTWLEIVCPNSYRTLTVMDFWHNPVTGKNEFGLTAYGGLVWQKLSGRLYYHNTSNLYTKKVQFTVEDVDVPSTSHPSWGETIIFKSGFTNDYYVSTVNTSGSNKYLDITDYAGGKKFSALKSAGDCQPQNRVTSYIQNGSFNFEWWAAEAGTDFFISQYGLFNSLPNPSKTTSTEIVKPEEKVAFDIKQRFPFVDSDSIPSSISITDTLDKAIDVQNISLKVYKKDGTDVSSLWNTSISGQTVSFSAKTPSNIMGLDLRFHIEAKLKTNANFSGYSKANSYYEIPNKATVKVASKTLQTNEVKVKVPYYKITTEVENGVIDSSVDELIPGSSKTINYHENDGYMIKSITVDGATIDWASYFNSYTFTNIQDNHHIKVVYEKIPTVDLTVQKNWDDTNNNDGFRPTSITVNFLKNNVVQETLTLNANNSWKASKTNLRLYTPRREIIIYDWSENMNFANVDKYKQTGKTTSDGTTIFTNTHELEKVESKITKIWDDTDNQDGFRPEEVQMQLYKNDVVIKTITLNEDNNWEYIESDLLKYSPLGQLNTYYWREVQSFTNYDKYMISNTVQSGYDTTITNHHTLERIESKITKIWDDTNNNDGFRPNSIDMKLYKDGIYVKTITLNEGNNWTYIEPNLLKYSPIGKLVTYTWEEDLSFENYDKYSISNTQVEGYNTTITNYHKLDEIESEVKKVWDDTDNHDGFRPDSVDMKLYKDGVYVKTITLNNDNNWTYTEKNLLKYKPTGQLVTYSWEEDLDFTNHNKYELADTQVEGYDTTFTNHHTLERIESTITKVWDDTNNHDGFRPDSVDMKLYKDGVYVKTITVNKDNNWTYTEPNLLKYSPIGKLVTYTWEEDLSFTNHDKYSISNTQVEGYNTTITNYHKLEEVESQIIKHWQDTNDNDGYRPDEVEMILYKNDVEYKRVTVKASEGWKYSEKNLLKYSPIGQLNTYYWRENENYINHDKYEILETIQKGYNTEITNSHESEIVSSTIIKVWDDEDNNDGFRPSTIYAKLYQDGKVIKDRVVLNDGNKFKWTEYNLLKYHDGGKEYQYAWDEYVTYDNADKYTYTKEQNGYNTTITNTHEVEKVEVHVEKLWNDNNNHDKVRPSSIHVNLLGNGKFVKQVELSAINNWETTISNLNKYESQGKLIYYTFEEPVLYYDYTSEVVTTGYDTAITNTRDLTKTSRTIKKVWDDNNNQDQMRPESIEIELLADGKTIQTIYLSEANNWTEIVNNLNYKNEDGEIIQYEFKEKNIPQGYKSTYDTDGKTTTITNTYVSEKTKVTVVKEWDDNNNQDGIRPSSVEMRLYANEEATKYKVSLNSRNNWTDSIANLNKYKNGKEIHYEFKEENQIKGYEASAEQNGNLTIITNTHVPETTESSVEKVWNDEDNICGIRPESIEVNLLANNKIVETLELNELNHWQETITDLPKYQSGEQIIYTWEETEEPSGYLVTYEQDGDKTIITNNFDCLVHAPEDSISVSIRKEWEDNNNVDKLRPDEIEVLLLANHRKIVKRVILNADNNWSATIDELNNANGLIEYTWEENGLPIGYYNEVEVRNNKTIMTNIHEPDKASVTLKKKWDDDNNRDGIRPESVKFALLANEKEIQEIELTEEDNWGTVITDLPLNDENGLIEYTCKELSYLKGYTSNVEVNGSLITVTNIHKPETTELKVTKNWVDDNNRDNLRSEEVKVNLLANDNFVEEIILNSQNNWTKTLTVSKYENGKVIKYQFVEETILENYQVTYQQKDNETVIINTYEPEKVTVEVQKEWIDENDKDSIRPNEVTVILMKDGELTDIKLVLNKDNNWYGEVENQPKYENGKEIVYNFVLENDIDKYETSYKQDGYKTIITSEHHPEEVTLKIKKVWVDDNNKDGVRPNEVTVVLVVDGKPSDIKIKLNKDNDWQAELNQPKYKDGKEVKYNFILEKDIDKYETTYEQREYETIITSIYSSEKVQPEVQIVWDDLDNKYQKRPDEAIVRLYIDGELSDIVITLNQENNWYKQLEAMPKYNKDGKEIEYKFVEDVPKDYKESYEYTESKTIITNLFRKEEDSVITTPPQATSKQQELVEINETTSAKPNLKDGKANTVRTEDSTVVYLLLVLLFISSIILIYKNNKKPH